MAGSSSEIPSAWPEDVVVVVVMVVWLVVVVAAEVVVAVGVESAE